ncbi:deoxyribodipyrimidine photo-lyase [Nocardia yunnanensis]|uniref:Deoxyribodipyrimidine photo-lyase n=1 Tax=Nocardia yunnanensis TaxID=2382165 RepID=A0A386Z9L9_9NOCA|nr:deoxyribodipyrimidine photo-lyase [Nocardia yunnanensis]AYF73863.1 deoxyribodipyrimidine photo-lyase [Nocardia yunnanensis]
MTASIVLFTRDLRVHDNPALDAACREADAVVPLFVFDDELLARVAEAPNRIRFLLAALTELDGELRARGGRLVVRRGQVAEEVARLAAEVHAREVHLAEEVTGYGLRRDARIRERLARIGCAVHTHPGSLTAVAASALRPDTGRDHYAVFGPYFRRWLDTPMRKPLPAPDAIVVPSVAHESIPDPDTLASGEGSPDLAVGGETTGRKLLEHWLSGPVRSYADLKDLPAADATSGLSPYLHFGCVSAAEVAFRTDASDPGGHAFIRQVAWRDFYHQVLAADPGVAVRDYRTPWEPWRSDPQAVAAWCAGRTGYPMVDAGMRQLLAQGIMPGRARLIAASFLVKTLRVDWRVGARHFERWLVDADVANNRMNWQWMAGTGTDTRSSRVLNPLRQADRFDPDGDYARRWLPELAALPGAEIHRPWRAGVFGSDYPPPIVEFNGM